MSVPYERARTTGEPDSVTAGNECSRIAHWLTRYDPDDGEPYGEICRCAIGDDHDAAGGVMQVVPPERVRGHTLGECPCSGGDCGMIHDDDMAADRVRRGAELLDRREPGWAERIDLGRLKLSDSCLCVIGQLNGGLEPDPGSDNSPYGIGMFALEVPVLDEADHGFDLLLHEAPEGWAELDRLWEVEIRARREDARADGTSGGGR